MYSTVTVYCNRNRLQRKTIACDYKEPLYCIKMHKNVLNSFILYYISCLSVFAYLKVRLLNDDIKVSDVCKVLSENKPQPLK